MCCDDDQRLAWKKQEMAEELPQEKVDLEMLPKLRRPSLKVKSRGEGGKGGRCAGMIDLIQATRRPARRGSEADREVPVSFGILREARMLEPLLHDVRDLAIRPLAVVKPWTSPNPPATSTDQITNSHEREYVSTTRNVPAREATLFPTIYAELACDDTSLSRDNHSIK